MTVSKYTANFVTKFMQVNAKERGFSQSEVQNLRLMLETCSDGGKLAMPPNALLKEDSQWQNASEHTCSKIVDMIGVIDRAQQHLTCRIQNMQTTLSAARATLQQSSTPACSPEPEHLPLPFGLGPFIRKDDDVERSIQHFQGNAILRL